jgi:SAM-dependent methyltransferase
MLTTAGAIELLRTKAEYAQLIRDSYLSSDTELSARAFEESAEFREVTDLLASCGRHPAVLDLGAGTGIASRAFTRLGWHVIAVEPDSSEIVGRDALKQIKRGHKIQVLGAIAENIPLADGCVDVVYVRQVLHHLRDLPAALREVSRVLRSGGLFLACREHVADDHAQLEAFLKTHPVHQLAGGEHAFKLSDYRSAIVGSGLRVLKVLGPWDSVINAYPAVRSASELERYSEIVLTRRFGSLGRIADRIPPIRWLVWKRIRRALPGRMYSFLAVKG